MAKKKFLDYLFPKKEIFEGYEKRYWENLKKQVEEMKKNWRKNLD